MLHALSMVRTFLGSLHRSEQAQDAFEYVLVVGGVTVAVILAIATPVGTNLIDAVVIGTCSAVSTIPGNTIDCTTIT